MSDDYISIVPIDPEIVPSQERQGQAERFFREIAPEVDEITVEEADLPQFFDCGSNLDSIACPHCRSQIDRDWWEDTMGEDYAGSHFKLAPYETACCGTPVRMNELLYDFPQAFARFGLSGMNPNIGELKDDQIRRFEELLGTKVQVVYQHI